MADSSKWKTSLNLEWNTELPYKGRDRVSPVFVVRGIQYRFRFYCENNYFVNLKLIDEASQRRCGEFSVTVRVDFTKGSSFDLVYGPTSVTCSLGRYCFYIQKSTITSKVENDLSLPLRNMMKFLFTFHSADMPGLPGLEDKRADKSIQTPMYLDSKFELENLSQDLAKLMQGEDSSRPNVELVCGDSTFKAHRCLLSVRSDVFRAMLESDMTEGNTGKVNIEDVDAGIFQQFLGYLYKGRLEDLTLDTATQLYKLGDKYAVEALKKQCGSFLAENVAQDNVCGLLSLADQHSDRYLKEVASAYIVEQKIPLQDDRSDWTSFTIHYPLLAVEVVTRLCKLLDSK